MTATAKNKRPHSFYCSLCGSECTNIYECTFIHIRTSVCKRQRYILFCASACCPMSASFSLSRCCWFVCLLDCFWHAHIHLCLSQMLFKAIGISTGAFSSLNLQTEEKCHRTKKKQKLLRDGENPGVASNPLHYASSVLAQFEALIICIFTQPLERKCMLVHGVVSF